MKKLNVKNTLSFLNLNIRENKFHKIINRCAGK